MNRVKILTNGYHHETLPCTLVTTIFSDKGHFDIYFYQSINQKMLLKAIKEKC